MLIAGLSGGHKLGLGLMGAAFIVFALASAFLLPRWRADFPGRGLRAFVVLCLAFFAAMIAAVIVFGREAKAEGEKGHPAAAGAATVAVSLVEWKVKLPKTTLKPGKYTFDVSNDGTIPHNLTIDGPKVQDAHTPTFAGGQKKTLDVTLAAGTYDFYCSVPGHKQQGMDVKVTVSS